MGNPYVGEENMITATGFGAAAAISREVREADSPEWMLTLVRLMVSQLMKHAMEVERLPTLVRTEGWLDEDDNYQMRMFWEDDPTVLVSISVQSTVMEIEGG